LFDLLIAEINPTPNPAKKRPARNRGIEVAAVCKITPKVKTKEDVIKPIRRPIASATGAAVRAPKKVPAERIETIVADCDAVTSRWPLLFTKPVENWSCQKGMARIPLIVPVSYLLGEVKIGGFIIQLM
jgi:hypothetical protein